MDGRLVHRQTDPISFRGTRLPHSELTQIIVTNQLQFIDPSQTQEQLTAKHPKMHQ
jgi:hypothetical protein